MPSPQPPLTPEETLSRVLRAARLDGRSVLVVSGLFALISLVAGDIFGAVIGLLVCSAGAIELRGRAWLLAGETRGIRWLIGSQVWLLAVVLTYVLWQLRSYNPVLARQLILPIAHSGVMQPMLEAMGMNDAELLRQLRSVYLTAYMIAGVLSFCFQGGLALYYRNRRAAVTTALAARRAK
jgi:hypothetical protein